MVSVIPPPSPVSRRRGGGRGDSSSPPPGARRRGDSSSPPPGGRGRGGDRGRGRGRGRSSPPQPSLRPRRSRAFSNSPRPRLEQDLVMALGRSPLPVVTTASHIISSFPVWYGSPGIHGFQTRIVGPSSPFTPSKTSLEGTCDNDMPETDYASGDSDDHSVFFGQSKLPEKPKSALLLDLADSAINIWNVQILSVEFLPSMERFSIHFPPNIFTAALEGREVLVTAVDVKSSFDSKDVNFRIAAAAKRKHKNVLKLTGLCTNEDRAYIVYDLPAGCLISEMLHGDTACMKSSQMVDIASGICDGFLYITSCGDICTVPNTSNVWVKMDGCPVLLDTAGSAVDTARSEEIVRAVGLILLEMCVKVADKDSCCFKTVNKLAKRCVYEEYDENLSLKSVQDQLDIFRKDYKDIKLVSVAGKAGGEKWKSLSDAEKAPYVAKAEKLKAEYTKKIDAYNNHPQAAEVSGDSDKSKSEVNDENSGSEGDE